MQLYNKDNIDLTVNISFFAGTGPGGQHKNKKKCGVRLHHIDSDIVVTNNDSRSRNQNKTDAIEELLKRLNKYYTNKNIHLHENETPIMKLIIEDEIYELGIVRGKSAYFICYIHHEDRSKFYKVSPLFEPNSMYAGISYTKHNQKELDMFKFERILTNDDFTYEYVY